jgi:hypothetical protein
MNLVLSQKNTIVSTISVRRFDRRLLKPLARRWKALRLRRKRPEWIRIALLALAGDIVLAAAAWIVVDLFLR